MAIKDAIKVETKKETYAAGGSSVAMAEMPPHGANQVQPLPLPPGVYFSPTPMECLGLLNRSIAGDKEMRDTKGYVFGANIYGESPDVLRRRHRPASIRDRERTWWFLSQTKFQSQAEGGGASKRAARGVATGGYWRLEQSKEKLQDDGFKNCFGYYVDGHSKSKRKDKTAWLMQEFTSAHDDGAGKGGVPALYRVYVTPHASDNQLREIFGEEGVKHRPGGEKKPARAMVPGEYFDGIAALLPHGSVRDGIGQEHVQVQEPQPPPPLPPVAPEGLLDDFHNWSVRGGVGVGQEHVQEAPPLPPVAPERVIEDFCDWQEHYIGQYQQHLPPAPPEGCPDDFYSQLELEQYQYEQQQQGPPDDFYSQQEQYLDQYYDQQQGPLSVVAPPPPPPASPGLLAELAADAPSDNLSTSMAEIIRMVDEKPAETAQGEEPNWDSLDDILDEDELANMNKDG